MQTIASDPLANALAVAFLLAVWICCVERQHAARHRHAENQRRLAERLEESV